MTREQKIAKAQELRDRGLTYKAIGERLGVSRTCVWKYLNPIREREISRRSNLKRSPAKRAWERENRAECPGCGGVLGAGSACPSHRPSQCAKCVRDIARERIVHFIRLREKGLTNREIEKLEGLGSNVVATALTGAGRFGLVVPPSPYWSRGK